MAIELITGLPGHGKTLLAIARYKEIAEKEGRPVFHNGITGLKLPWPQWEVAKWEDLPAGAILIIDEAWHAFPMRGRRDDNAPEHIRNLATHRHKGVDIVLIAQNPLLIDAFVRRLIDRHWHIVRKFGTRSATLHEYPTGVHELVSKSRGQSIRHEWRYPAKVFELYQSAELHTVKRRIPARVWILMCMPLVVIALAWYIWHRLNPAAAAERAGAPGGGAAASAPAGRGLPLAGGGHVDTRQFLELQTPRIAGLAHTAPAYDDVTKPTEAPYPAACVSSAKRCKCYSQQATALAVPDELCRDLAAGGFFVAWRQNGERVQAPPAREARQEPTGALQTAKAAPAAISLGGGAPSPLPGPAAGGGGDGGPGPQARKKH